MSHLRPTRLPFLVLLALLLVAPAAHAFTWVEDGNAGLLIGTAQTVWHDGAVNSITGAALDLSDPGMSQFDVDMYQFYIADPAAFSASTVGSAFDTMLYLFDATGVGVYANNDLIGTAACLPAGHANSPQTPGIYYLAIAPLPQRPWGPGSADVFNMAGTPGAIGTPTGAALTEWNWGAWNQTGAYTIALTGVQGIPPVTPEPSTLALLGAGLALGAIRRRRARRGA